ncbi:MAG: hypothetical protein O7E52_19330 [Candidatus Poribacteria bacterium]|nr:hypothetical protein [Candidatus Poribacteria bacterium]
MVKSTRQGLILLVSMLIIGCGGPGKFIAPAPPPDDRQPVPKPEYRSINNPADSVNKFGTEQIKRIFDLSRYFRMIAGKPKQAMNVDAFGEVYDSSWFTNRNVIKRLSLEEIARGPNTGGQPDPNGAWTIFRAKAEGVTPGFSIEDEHGERYLIKFDPLGYPELATGAELVSTKMFYAAGYNVPENYIVYFHPKILRLGKKVKFKDKTGQKRFMNQTDLSAILKCRQKPPDGRIRAVASKYIRGTIGPFKYLDVRKDDANDFIPHQHRRELRGLRVMAAWLNHFDTKANNTFDSYVPEGYVKHYLIDFGSTLGSQGDEPMPPQIGRERIADPTQLIKTIGTLGAYIRPWERNPNIHYPSIGYFESKDFEPQKYKYIFPNPAFQNATNLDGYWGAKLVMSFTDERIRAAVAQGQYSDPEAAEYLIRTIIERRDIVGRYWFSRMPPLDRFELQQLPDGKKALCFADLAVETGLESAFASRYRYEIRQDEKLILKKGEIGAQRCIDLAEFGLTADTPNLTQWEIKLQVERNQSGKWSRWVKVYIGIDQTSGKRVLLGVQRQG